jgi:hypothetical protein
MPSLNYRNTPPGMCGLTEHEMEVMKQDYGTDKFGNILKK